MMPLSADQRRALAMLAGRNGATQLLLSAHGFSRAMIIGLVNRGFAVLTRGKVRGGGKVIDVIKVRITVAGREVLAEN
jgi:hypothetical protein